MRFGKTLRESTYAPWKDNYVDYGKLKSMLREDVNDDDDVPWSAEDEQRFCDEIFNTQLEKVADFQTKTAAALKDRVDSAFDQLRDLAPPGDSSKPGDITSSVTNTRLRELRQDLDRILNDLKELKKFTNLNYTAFLKIVKKHDRKRGSHYRLRPMMRVSLAQRGFNSEHEYSPLLNKLSLMYYAINQNLDAAEQQQQPLDLNQAEEILNGERYTAHKFWVHPDNLLEVKTAILRHLPALVYSQQAAKELDGNNDPKITSLYFDNSKFVLYNGKVSRQTDASSLRLRWYGQLSTKPDIVLEQKIIYENGTSAEKKFSIKDKYIKQYLDGDYKMEKSVQKMERQGQQSDSIDSFKATAEEIQNFVVGHKLGPVLRANYTRTAFQKPADDRVRISIDTDLAFIREDTLDESRPCRDPNEWHRADIDESNMTFPFKNINQSEVSKFPYAILEIKLKEEEGRKRPAWVDDLMASHLVYAAPKFSKFVHGAASLFEDYVNNLPFWLNDLEMDIRKDPQRAHDEEEQRRAREAEEVQAVGTLLGSSFKHSSSYKPAAGSPVAKSYLSERAAADAKALPPNSASRLRDQDTQAEEEDENAEASSSRLNGYGTLSSVLPGFSLSRYSRAKRQRAQLPKGVTKPEVWIKNAGPLQIEPKIWLANERTFLKWQHICVLLGTLAIGLYTAAGENFLAECMGIAYIVIAVMAGLWGNLMLHRRRGMIVERSGKDFDNMIGPLAVSIALIVALILNFVFAYRNAFSESESKRPAPNGTHSAFIQELI